MAKLSAEQYDTLQEMLKVITKTRQTFESLSESRAKRVANPIGPQKTHLSSPITPMTPSQSPQPPDPPDYKPNLTSKSIANKKFPLKYSGEEIYERMETGLCIFCDEQDIPGHYQLKHKRSQIFLIECEDEKEEAHQIQETVMIPEKIADSVPDVFMVPDVPYKMDSHVKEVEESPQQSTSGKGENVAHQLFDQKPERVTNKEKHLKHLKGWKFKFKGKNLSRVMPQIGQYELMKRKRNRYNKFSSNIQIEPMRTRISWEHWKAGKRQRISPFQLRSDTRSYLDVFLPIWLRDETQEKQRIGLSRAERVWKPGELMFLRKQWNWQSNVHNCEIIVNIARRLYGDSIVTMSAKFHETYEESQFELMCLKQSHDPVEIHLDNFESALTRSSLRHTPTYQYRAPFNPYQNSNDQCHYKREFDRASEEVEDDELQDKQPEDEVFSVDAETTAMNEDEQPLECDDEESCDDREPSEVTVEEIIDKSMDMIREEKSTPENESSPEVSPQILLSQFQVSLSSLEPGRRYHKESLVVVNDLSSDLGCVIGKTHGFNYDPERGQGNSLYEEEFKGFKLGKQSKNEKWLNTVCLLGLMDMSCRTQFSSLLKANEMLLRECDQWKWSEKPRTYNRAWKFKYIQRFMLSALLQNKQHKLLQGRNIKCKMRKMEVLRRIKQSIFIEVQFHMKKNSEFKFQANTSGAEFETTLHDGDTFQKPLEYFYRDCEYDYMALRVLELIRDRASRKRKLYKKWFKYKLNTWLSEALHCWRKRKHEKLQRASEDMMCELIYKIRKACHCVEHETNQTASHVWYGWITKAEIISIPIMDLKGKEETFSFNIAVKSCSMFYFFPYSTWMVSQNRHASSSCALRQEENYVLVLFIIIEALTLFNDQHTLVTEKNGTETSIVLKQIFGLATHQLLLKQSLSQVLLHIQNRDCSFFGYMLVTTSDCFGTLLEIPDKEIAKPHRIFFLTVLIQWKWYPPTQVIRSFTKLSMTSNQILYP